MARGTACLGTLGGRDLGWETGRGGQCQRPEGHYRQEAGGIECISVAPKRVVDPGADHGSNDARSAPGGEQEAIIHAEVAGSVNISRG